MTILFYLFLALALAAFTGFFIQSIRRNGHGMFYSAVMVGIWVAAAGWAGGYFGG